MPQPLSRVASKAPIHFGTPSFDDEPALAAKIMRVIHTGSLIEYQWALILIELLKADPTTGFAMYQALSGGEARRVALMAAAKARLCDEDFNLFSAISSTARSAAKQRNDFAHCLWGFSPDLPGRLLLVDPAHFAKLGVQAALKPRLHPTRRLRVDDSKLDRSLVQVYRESDIDRAINESENILFRLEATDIWLQSIGTDKPDVRTRYRLGQVPQVAQALQRLYRQNDQSTHPQEPQETPPEKS
jgi:hypothetical protein